VALLTGTEASHGIAPEVLDRLREREEARFRETHPQSATLYEQARHFMPHGTPLHWMSQWGTPFPVFACEAKGAHLTDADGHAYVDFCLGDSAALFGHANPAVVEVIAAEVTGRGSSYMLPTEDAIAVAENLGQRFGLPLWQLATSATDANRFALRIARLITGRTKVLVFNGKYHGSVDETQAELRDGRLVPQHGVSPNGIELDKTTKVIEFNDIAALEAALADRDVAAVLAEPHLTNIGMVRAAPGYHDALRQLTRDTGTLLIIDETHTICMGPAGGTGVLGLSPDMVVLGKVLSGGIPSAVYGMSEAIGRRMEALTPGGVLNHYGFGGTLAANALTVRAMRATLEHVMTAETYAGMDAVAALLEGKIASRIRRAWLPWRVDRMGARVEYLYLQARPTNGGQAGAARNDQIEQLSHLYFVNRGVLVSPFHNMGLISPFTTTEDVERYDAVFGQMLTDFTAD
jgi:glutamate-1-semialdehyde 2,1-aminomutase